MSPSTSQKTTKESPQLPLPLSAGRVVDLDARSRRAVAEALARLLLEAVAPSERSEVHDDQA